MLSKYRITIFSGGILIVCLFFSNLVLDITLNPRFLLFAAFLLIFSIYSLVINKNTIKIKSSIILFSLFVLFTVLSNIWALNLSLSIVEASKNILYLFFVSFLLNLLDNDKDKTYKSILKTIIILFIIEFVVFFFQFIQLENYSRNELYSIIGLNGHKNLFSIFIFLSLVFTLLAIKELKKYWRTFAIILSFVQLFLIIFLQTRSVWIGTLVFIIVFLFITLLKNFVRSFNTPKAIITSICLMLISNIFFYFAFPKIINSLKNSLHESSDIKNITDHSTLNERILVWDKTYSFFNEHKAIGVGANNWQIYFPSNSLPEIYPVTDLNVSFQRPHNDFLWILSEYGIIGFNLFLFIIIAICCSIFKNIITIRNHRDIIILSGIIGFFCISFFDFPKERIELSILFLILLSFGIHFSKFDSTFNFLKLTFKSNIVNNTIIISIMSFITYVAILNLYGEIKVKQLHAEKILGNNGNIINLTNLAYSFCYKMDPTSIPIKFYSGNAYIKLQDFNNAKKDILEAYNLHPYNQHVLNDLGSMYYINEDIDSAVYYYKRAIFINPRYDEPILNLIVININQGDFVNASILEKNLLHDSEIRNYYKSIIDSNL